MINYLSVSRKLMCASALFAVFTSSALGLGFGKMDVASGLGEPFSARINLTSLYAGDSEQLSVALASLEDFARAGLDRADVLDKLQFAIAYDDAGQPYISVSSDSPIDEPLLQFMVALQWQGGKLVRNFNALLDPPTYARNGSSIHVQQIEATTEIAAAETYSQPAQTIEQPIEPVEPVTIEQPTQEFVIVESAANESTEQESIATTELAVSDTELSSFTVKRGQSLWIVADRTRDVSTTVYQMMMAIYNANPRAFVRGDINKLKAGATLTIPAGELRDELSHAEAIAAFQRTAQGQHSPDNIAAVKSESATTPSADVAQTAAKQPESAVTAMASTNAGEANQPGETIELTNAGTDAVSAETAETAASTSELSVASAQFEQNAGASEFALSNTDNKTLDLLTQEVALLETTLAQANAENQGLKERINDLENKVDFATRFLEFQNIALSITGDDNAASISDTVGTPATQSNLETTQQEVTASESVDNAGSNDTQAVIREGLLAATEALSESGDALTQSEQDTLVASEQQPNHDDNASSTTDAASSNADSGESRWTAFQDKVVTRFDGLKSLFATSTSQPMQPILTIVAVAILALGALVAIFRHRSFAPAKYTAYPSNSGSITRSTNRQSLQSYGAKATDATKKRSEKTAADSASPTTANENANTDKQSVKYAGASTLIEQAEVYMALGREDKAEETLKNAIKGGSVDTEASMKLMEIYQKRPPETSNPAPNTSSDSSTQRATTAPSVPVPDPVQMDAIKPSTPEIIPDPDIMQALVPSAPAADSEQTEATKSSTPEVIPDPDIMQALAPSAPTADSEQTETLKPTASEISQAESKPITIPPVSDLSKREDNTPVPSVSIPDSGQIEAAKPATPAPDPGHKESLRPRVEKPVERSPLDQLSTAPPPSKSGDGIPMFDVGDDGLSPTERAALRKAAMTAEVDTKPDDVEESEPKMGRRSRLLQAAQGTQFETRSKDDQIKDLESKLDALQSQMDEILRRLSRDDSSNSSGGAA